MCLIFTGYHLHLFISSCFNIRKKLLHNSPIAKYSVTETLSTLSTVSDASVCFLSVPL